MRKLLLILFFLPMIGLGQSTFKELRQMEFENLCSQMRDKNGLEILKQKILSEKKEVQEYYYKGCKLLQKRKYKAAKVEFDKAIDLNRDFAYAYFLKGFVWHKLGDSGGQNHMSSHECFSAANTNYFLSTERFSNSICRSIAYYQHGDMLRLLNQDKNKVIRAFSGAINPSGEYPFVQDLYNKREIPNIDFIYFIRGHEYYEKAQDSSYSKEDRELSCKEALKDFDCAESLGFTDNAILYSFRAEVKLFLKINYCDDAKKACELDNTYCSLYNELCR